MRASYVHAATRAGAWGAVHVEATSLSLSMIPLYQQVRQHVLEQIASGALKVGDRVPSEMELVQQLSTSRMTVNRALRELTNEGVLVRVQGVGTFVGDRKAHGHPLKIRSIADEVKERGGTYSARVLAVEKTHAGDTLARTFGIAPGAALYRSSIVHQENDIPLQLEERFVNPALAPDYVRADFSRMTPYEYLIKVAPLQEVEHVVRAVMPSIQTREHLHMAAGEPCLLIHRRTWTDGQLATVTDLYHPASRYELSGRFRP